MPAGNTLSRARDSEIRCRIERPGRLCSGLLSAAFETADRDASGQYQQRATSCSNNVVKHECRLDILTRAGARILNRYTGRSRRRI
jgi:hypothetical protein